MFITPKSLSESHDAGYLKFIQKASAQLCRVVEMQQSLRYCVMCCSKQEKWALVQKKKDDELVVQSKKCIVAEAFLTPLPKKSLFGASTTLSAK